ncbi:acyltransferase [Sphingomonas panacisoli]|uniref:Acyltransferase n=1 Tax=Sphingomonas panacisoli TaxID=1813879 RepID=A0A5B8LJY3_9SPHN|nr:acyltransferase [Sphingomonas panacisoli]QDZ08035.1 acyltransferase [Sphingomonas panacisoli]
MAIVTDGATRHQAEIPALDGLRALAITIVMCSHVGLQNVMPGQFGVTLFFFLSGYLITTLLRREFEQHGRISFRQFYLRRAVRILPPMYITIAFLAVLSLIGVIHPLSWIGVPFDLAFLTNYFSVSGVPIGLWSLAVEEHFYVAFPLLLWMLARRFSMAQCAIVLVGLCAIVLGVRLSEAQRVVDLKDINFWTHTRIDSILFGSILALWNNPVIDRKDVLPKGVAGYLLATALLLPTFTIRDEAFRQTYRYTIQGCGLLVLFNVAIRDTGVVAAALNNQLTRQIATLSYTLYLVHTGMIMAFSPADGTHPVAATLGAFAASIAYALAMHRWIERPLNNRRRQIEQSWRHDQTSVVSDAPQPENGA